MEHVRSLVEWFVPAGVARSAEGARAQTAVGVALLMVVVFVALSAAHLAARAYCEAAANVVLALGTLAGPLALRWTGRYGAVVQGTLAFAFGVILFIVLRERGAGLNAATLALAEVPLFATLLSGPRAGAAWTLLCCVVTTVIGLAGHEGWLRAPAQGRGLLNDHAVLVIVTATLSLVAALYERGRAQGLRHIAALEAARRQHEIEKLEAQAQARLAHAEHLASLGRIAVAAAHEINNPLCSVKGNVEFVAQRAAVAADPEAVGALADALDGVRRIQRIVADLRAPARPPEEVLGALRSTDSPGPGAGGTPAGAPGPGYTSSRPA